MATDPNSNIKLRRSESRRRDDTSVGRGDMGRMSPARDERKISKVR